MRRIQLSGLILIAALISAAWLRIAAPVQSQIAPINTPKPTDYPLLFVEDDCSPPCWFGLVPGETTVEEAEAIFEANPVAFGSPEANGDFGHESGLLIDGSYAFYLGPAGRRWEMPVNGVLRVRDGRIYTMIVPMNSYVTLGQLLGVLGTPDDIRFGSIVCNDPLLLFAYQDELLGISFRIREPYGSRTGYCLDRDICHVATITEDYLVDVLVYYSPEAATQLVTGSEIPPQPVGYHRPYRPYHRPISFELWEMWLSGAIDMTCMDAWESLPPVFPPSPTPAPADS